MSDSRPSFFNAPRRTFLRSLGLAAGAVAVNPMGLFGKQLSVTQAPGSAIARMPRIGIIVPGASSSQYSGEHFTSGFMCYCDEVFGTAGVSPRIVVEECDKLPHRALKQVTSMIESGTVDIVIAPLNATAAIRLHPVLEAHKTLFINIDAGANIVRDREESEYIFHSSLSHCEANAALGRHAAERYGRNVMIASSAVESGYDALYAFRCGVEAVGGIVVATHIAPGGSMAQEQKAAIAQIREVRPDVVCAMYCGAEADAFLKLYMQSGLSRSIPLVAPSFTVAEARLRTSGATADGVRTCAAWSRGIDTAVNAAFVERCERYSHHRADVFSVLGYDTARMIVEAVRTARGATSAAAVAAALPSVQFESPRGLLSVNAQTRSVETPLYLCDVRGSGRTCVHDVVERLGKEATVHAAASALRHAMRSGVTHSYLTA